VGFALCVTLCLLDTNQAYTQSAGRNDLQEAQQLYEQGRLQEAESRLRKITRVHAEDVPAQMILGQVLFDENKLDQAIDVYAKVLALENSGFQFSLTQHRILYDQLAMAYGLSGRLQEAKSLLGKAMTSDPEYPLNYYNLACLFAETDDKAKVMENLKLAFKYKQHVIPGERMPDPSSDSSFAKYRNDADFRNLLQREEKQVPSN
jgi:predicted Zn-dependent protease